MKQNMASYVSQPCITLVACAAQWLLLSACVGGVQGLVVIGGSSSVSTSKPMSFQSGQGTVVLRLCICDGTVAQASWRQRWIVSLKT